MKKQIEFIAVCVFILTMFALVCILEGFNR